MRPLTFGLTGREFQESFNLEKYIALAYQQPKGKLLQQMVEERWLDWVDTVANAPWRTYWKKSKYWKQPGYTPGNMHYDDARCGNVPLTIYSSAVWGFGIDGWLKKPGVSPQAPVYDVLLLQNVKDPRIVRNRTHMWDDKLYRGCGLQLPAEFGYLDRWLEPMWQEVCKQAELADQVRLKNAAQPLFRSAT